MNEILHYLDLRFSQIDKTFQTFEERKKSHYLSIKDPEVDRVNLETVIGLATQKVKAYQKVSGQIETSKPLSPRKLARPLVGEILSILA
jgi:hypothetical protein